MIFYIGQCSTQPSRLLHSGRFIFHYGDIISIWCEARFISEPLKPHLSTQRKVLLSRQSSKSVSQTYSYTHPTWDLLSADPATCYGLPICFLLRSRGLNDWFLSEECFLMRRCFSFCFFTQILIHSSSLLSVVSTHWASWLALIMSLH